MTRRRAAGPTQRSAASSNLALLANFTIELIHTPAQGLRRDWSAFEVPENTVDTLTFRCPERSLMSELCKK